MKEKKMKPTSKMIVASAVTLFASAFLVVTAPAAYADEYCLAGPQAAHGCGFPSMDECQAASSGIGGTCSRAAVARSSAEALAYQPKRQPSRSGSRPAKKPAGIE
jgi:hypothetical protein